MTTVWYITVQMVMNIRNNIMDKIFPLWKENLSDHSLKPKQKQ